MTQFNLNPSQKQAVEETEGPVMILAGAGSGKTRTLVTRIQYLLEDKRISPFHVLAVTFSNKAAREMRERVAQQAQMDIGALQITTFHSMCARILRMEAEYLGLSRNFTIYDDSESKAIAKSILAKHGISQKELPPTSILYYVASLKNQGYYAGHPERSDFIEDEVDTDDEFYQYYLEYEKELHRSNALDFGGLIVGVIQLFETYPDTLERYRKRFKYILVDEYQDTNRAQFVLLNLLANQHRNLCVVGDEDQSIYSWRGADIRNILDFEEIYNEAKTIKLEQNYRSSKNIIEAASHVISHNQHRKGKEMWTDNNEGESICIMECRDDKTECEFVVEEIKALKKEGVSLDDMAIFYRNNSQSRVIEDALRKTKFSYRIVGGIKFYDRKEIKDLLAYVRIIVNPKDSLALSRIINVPARGIGATSLRKLESEAIKNDCSLFEIIEKISYVPDDFSHLRLSTKIKSALKELAFLLEECKVQDSEGEKPHLVYEKILHESGYLDYLRADKNYESLARIENLEELSSAIQDYESDNKEPSLAGFLESVTLDQNKDSETNADQLSLMTVHGSKGLEYPYVFVVGCEETVFPSYQSLEGGDMAIEEERRLFYVAMTRAMKKLFISFARGRMLWGNLQFNGPSRFIDEVPEQYYEWKFYNDKRMAQKPSSPKGIHYDNEYSQETYEESPKVKWQDSAASRHSFPKGSNVHHKLYGKGVVMQADGHGNDEKVTIQFSDGLKKKFLVKFAPLELL
jgi:DNA helicase-2/ATP-dependent DNA helicase PcrA